MLLRRLKAVRIALRGADPATASVAEIAGGCGFTELGRFAGVYQTAFGESPSTTLRRLGPKIAGSA
jgi:transcriptional regulator GlxA family with amidase domain